MVIISLIENYRSPNLDKISKWLWYPYRFFEILFFISKFWKKYVQKHWTLYCSVTICSFTTFHKAQPAACIYHLICRSKLWLDWIPLVARIFNISHEFSLNHSESSVLREFGGVGFFPSRDRYQCWWLIPAPF